MLGSDIKNLVVVKMEEYTPYGPTSATLLAGDSVSQVKPVEAYINETLAEAANEMLLIVPLHKLTYKEESVTGTPGEDNRIGTIVLPSDFLRLHTLRMAGWEKPVHAIVTEENPAYVLQFKRWTRGTKQKPVVTRSELGELHYYSVDASDEHEVKEFKYIPAFDEEDKELDYEASIAELIALHCARKIYEVYGNGEQVAMITNEINSVLENLRQ